MWRPWRLISEELSQKVSRPETRTNNAERQKERHGETECRARARPRGKNRGGLREKAIDRECGTEGDCKSGGYIEQKSKSAGDRLAGSTTEDTIERQREGRESEHDRAREKVR